MKLEIKKLTQRDVLLLFLMAIFLLVAGTFWFLIRPLSEQIYALEGEMEDLQVKKQQNGMYTGLLEGAEEQLSVAESEYAALEEAFLPDGRSEEIEKRLTKTVLSYDGLEIRSLSIKRDSGNASLAPYNGIAATYVDLYSYAVGMEIRGERETLQKLIDLWAGGTDEAPADDDCIVYPDLWIESFSWQSAPKGNDGTVQYTLKINVKVFVLNKDAGDNAGEGA